MRNQGPLKSSLNAGELSSDLYAKVGLKQFYSGAKRMKNLEPVPQSGCRLAPGSAYVDNARSDQVRLFCLPVSASLSYMLVFTDGKVDIYRAGNRTLVKTITSGQIQLARLPEYEFYGEANTVGVFHEDDSDGVRILKNDSDETVWALDHWPYESKPKVDLGGTYDKTPDKWEIYLRYTSDTDRLAVSLTVDGETTEAVNFIDATTGDPSGPSSGSVSEDDYELFADNIAAALNALPTISSGVTCDYLPGLTSDKYRVFRVTFGGALSGSEYEFDCTVVNTSIASTLVAHTQIGKTDLEPLISGDRGGFAGMMLWQDRAVYWAAKAEKAALAMSDVGEYFKLDITKTGDQYARLERLRTQTSQKILSVVEGTYLVVFTNSGEWFINNRTVKQSEPLNFVTASRIGTKKGVTPQEFDGDLWFISKDGSSLYTINYDAVQENYTPVQKDLLATHLVNRVKRQWVQRKIDGSTTPRLWQLREDGRLVYGVVIKDQDITAFCEWRAADDGFICDICPDGADRMWMVVKRGSKITLEVMEEADDNLFHCSIDTATDLAGQADGLGLFNGKQVWARIDGYIDGPFTVSGGTIQTDFPSKGAQVGLWQPPVLESMPYYRVLPNEELLWRPARIHTVTVNLLGTESIAIGANGRPPKPVSLLRAADDVTVAPPPYNGSVEVSGLIGATIGPTVTITQTRPGRLRIRDYIPGVKF